MTGVQTCALPILAEYRSETAIEDFFNNGCSAISSKPTLFGYAYSTDTNKLRGYSSYSDEVFTLKDIHAKIDKF